MKCKTTYHILELYDEVFSILVISTVPWLYIMILKFIITLFFTDGDFSSTILTSYKIVEDPMIIDCPKIVYSQVLR